MDKDFIKNTLFNNCQKLDIQTTDDYKIMCNNLGNLWEQNKDKSLEDLPTELILSAIMILVKNNGVNSVGELCKVNRRFKNVCKNNELYIKETILRMNKINPFVKNKYLDDIDENLDKSEIIKIRYKQFLNTKYIEYGVDTPLFPNLKEMVIRSSNFKEPIFFPQTLEKLEIRSYTYIHIPDLPNLKKLSYNNYDTYMTGGPMAILPYTPKLEELEIIDSSVDFNNNNNSYPLLKKLTCKGFHNNPLPEIFHNLDLEYLNISRSFIKNFPSYPNLKTLICMQSNIDILPYYPKLINLICPLNNITSIPPYPLLENLDCSYNNITTLPVYPNLRYLDIRSTNITQLPIYPKLLKLTLNNRDMYITMSLPPNTEVSFMN